MNSGSDLADRLHAHEVVCKTALKLAVNTPGWRSHNKIAGASLHAIGTKEFGLNEWQVAYCLGRARNFLREVREADRARNKARKTKRSLSP